MFEHKNNVLSSCVTVLLVIGVFICILIAIGAGILISNLARVGL